MMKKSRNLAISLAFHISIALWVAQIQAIALGFVKNLPFIDFLKETTVFFLKKWAGWMEKDENTFKIEVIPVLKPPVEFDIRPP